MSECICNRKPLPDESHSPACTYMRNSNPVERHRDRYRGPIGEGFWYLVERLPENEELPFFIQFVGEPHTMDECPFRDSDIIPIQTRPSSIHFNES